MRPLSRTGTLPSCFGGDDQIGGVWIQRFRNQFFRHSRSIGISCVDEIHVRGRSSVATLQGRKFFVSGRSPNAWTSNPHGSVSEAIDREIAPYCERTSRGCRINLFVNHGFRHIVLSLVLRLSSGFRNEARSISVVRSMSNPTIL